MINAGQTDTTSVQKSPSLLLKLQTAYKGANKTPTKIALQFCCLNHEKNMEELQDI